VDSGGERIVSGDYGLSWCDDFLAWAIINVDTLSYEPRSRRGVEHRMLNT